MARKKPKEKVPVIMYILAFLLGPIFGILFYFMYERVDKEGAKNLLIISFVPLVFVAIGVAMYALMAPLYEGNKTTINGSMVLSNDSFYYLDFYASSYSKKIVYFSANDTIQIWLVGPSQCYYIKETGNFPLSGAKLVVEGKTYSNKIIFHDGGTWCYVIVPEDNNTLVKYYIADE